jgi:hypothetical protein
MHVVGLREVKYRPHKRRFLISYVLGNIQYAILQLNPRARFHCKYQGLHTSLKELSPVTSVASQPETATLSDSF